MTYDVLIIGAGPGGLQAAIAAASEGLSVLVVEKGKIGGQIGQTPLLENSVFAAGGITGPQFAEMMKKQALAMGAEFVIGEAEELVTTSNGKDVVVNVRGHKRRHYNGRTLILALGMRWLELDIPGVRENIGKGIFIGPVKSITHKAPGADVAVYGGGPSAGQAILALANSSFADRVKVLMRSTLRMPQYLVDRIRSHPKVDVYEHTTIERIVRSPSGSLFVHTAAGEGWHVNALFMCNGLAPDTSWLPKWIAVDEFGQIETNASVVVSEKDGIFAIGDCRVGSTPRVGVAIGDGSMAITEVWKYFQQHPVCRRCKEIFGA